MPIFRVRDKLVFFAHVPKAGGTSVTDFLTSESDASAFLFKEHWLQKPKDRWSMTSPQHIDARSHSELFPIDFFDYSFAVVRHPEDRIVSEYRYRIGKSKMHSILPFSSWLNIVLSAAKVNPYVFDGHLRPQSECIPLNCKVFKLEEGLATPALWISQELNIDLETSKFDFHSNKSKAQSVVLSRQDLALIRDFYERDYKTFDYPRKDEPGTKSLGILYSLVNVTLGLISRAITRLLSTRIPY